MKESTGLPGSPKGFTQELWNELQEQTKIQESSTDYSSRRVPQSPPSGPKYLVQPPEIQITSISNAAKSLRAMQRNWAYYSTTYDKKEHLTLESLLPLLCLPSPRVPFLTANFPSRLLVPVEGVHLLSLPSSAKFVSPRTRFTS